jgi:hypothetical protein
LQLAITVWHCCCLAFIHRLEVGGFPTPGELFMSQQLTLEISDEVYANLQQKADAVGVPITEWIVAVLSGQGSPVSSILVSLERLFLARMRLRNHAGAISLGYATGSDNDQIDTALSKVYADDYNPDLILNTKGSFTIGLNRSPIGFS